jgi:hypothetical protein
MTILFGFIIFVATRDVSSLSLQKLFSSITLAAHPGILPLSWTKRMSSQGDMLSLSVPGFFSKEYSYPFLNKFLIVFVESSTLNPLRTTHRRHIVS